MEPFSGKELKFILDNEICRIATAKNNIPHVVPVCYIYKNNNIFFASDYKTKKYQNLLKNKRISVIIDLYDKKNGNNCICYIFSIINRFFHICHIYTGDNWIIWIIIIRGHISFISCFIWNTMTR